MKYLNKYRVHEAHDYVLWSGARDEGIFPGDVVINANQLWRVYDSKKTYSNMIVLKRGNTIKRADIGDCDILAQWTPTDGEEVYIYTEHMMGTFVQFA